jgi:hypothetical protein
MQPIVTEPKLFNRQASKTAPPVSRPKEDTESNRFLQWLVFKPQLHAVEPFETNMSSRAANTITTTTTTTTTTPAPFTAPTPSAPTPSAPTPSAPIPSAPTPSAPTPQPLPAVLKGIRVRPGPLNIGSTPELYVVNLPQSANGAVIREALMDVFRPYNPTGVMMAGNNMAIVRLRDASLFNRAIVEINARSQAVNPLE